MTRQLDDPLHRIVALERRLRTLEAVALRRLSVGAIDYTPALTAATTDPTLGTGSRQTGRYARIGALVYANIVIRFGTSGTNAGSGRYYVSLPVDAASNADDPLIIGHGMIFQSGVGRDEVEARLISGDTDKVAMSFTSPAATADVDHNTPFAWNTTDLITLNLTYEAA